MKRSATLMLFLAAFAVLVGYLLSNISFIGKVGISVAYEEYAFLKVWWKDTLLVLVIWLFLYFFQTLIQRWTTRPLSIAVDVVALLAAIAGMVLSFLDFRRDLADRWLGEQFHLGVYLFWVGWMIISIYLLLGRRNKQAMKQNVGMEM